MTDSTITYAEIAQSFAQHVQEFHRGLPVDEQQLLELVFRLAEQASADGEMIGYVDLGRLLSHHARPFIAAAAVAGALGLAGVTGTAAVHASPSGSGVVQAVNSLTATPNPVLLQAGQSSGTTTISWSTNRNAIPTFMISIDGGPEQPAQDLNRAGAKSSGSLVVGGIQKGHTYRLRMITQAQAGGLVLGDVTITAEDAPVAPMNQAVARNVVATNTGNGGGTNTGGITRPAPSPAFTVTPHGTFAELRVSSVVAARMVMVVSTEAPNADRVVENAVATFDSERVLGSLATNIEGLQPSTDYFFTLSATGADGQQTVRQGQFRTKDRFITVQVDEIKIDRDGRVLGRGAVQFTLSAGAESESTGIADVEDGTVLRPKLTVVSANAGPLLPFFVFGKANATPTQFERNEIDTTAIGTAIATRTGAGESFFENFETVGDSLLFKFTVKGTYQVSYR